MSRQQSVLRNTDGYMLKDIDNQTTDGEEKSGVGEQRSSYGTRSITALMESATLWKVDATEAALLAEAGLDRFP
jgi:hypothetical protein